MRWLSSQGDLAHQTRSPARFCWLGCRRSRLGGWAPSLSCQCSGWPSRPSPGWERSLVEQSSTCLWAGQKPALPCQRSSFAGRPSPGCLSARHTSRLPEAKVSIPASCAWKGCSRRSLLALQYRAPTSQSGKTNLNLPRTPGRTAPKASVDVQTRPRTHADGQMRPRVKEDERTNPRGSGGVLTRLPASGSRQTRAQP